MGFSYVREDPSAGGCVLEDVVVISSIGRDLMDSRRIAGRIADYLVFGGVD